MENLMEAAGFGIRIWAIGEIIGAIFGVILFIIIVIAIIGDRKKW